MGGEITAFSSHTWTEIFLPCVSSSPGTQHSPTISNEPCTYTWKVPEGCRGLGAALLIEECFATWLCPQINRICPLLSNNMSHLGIPLAVTLQTDAYPPDTSFMPPTDPWTSLMEWEASGITQHPEPPPRALFQTITMGLPKLLQQQKP